MSEDEEEPEEKRSEVTDVKPPRRTEAQTLVVLQLYVGWNNGADPANSDDEEGHSLQEQVDPEVVVAVHYIIHPAVAKHTYFSPIGCRGFLCLLSFFCLSAFPSFSVTTHSLTRLVSSRPVMVAFARCMDITFSNRIQKISSAEGVEDSDGGRDINSNDLVDADFRDQHACGDDNAVEVEGLQGHKTTCAAGI